MIDFLFLLAAMMLGFLTVFFLSLSNIKFTEGDLRKIIENFIYGTILVYGFLTSEFFFKLFSLNALQFVLIKYSLLIGSFYFYLLASYRIYEMSKVFGFAGKLPEKLRKILE